MTAFPKGKLSERRGKATMQKKARDEMVKAFETELKELVRNLPESFMREELAMHLETHPTSANGYYTCDLLNPRRAGRGPQGFSCTGRRLPSRDSPLGKFPRPSTHPGVSPSDRGHARSRGLLAGVRRGCFGWALSLLRRRETVEEPVEMVFGIKPNGRREILRFYSSAPKGKVLGIGKRCSRTSTLPKQIGRFVSCTLYRRRTGMLWPRPSRRPLGPRHKGRPRKLCGVYGSSGAWFTPKSWSAGRPRLMLFWLSSVIQGPFAATSTPRSNGSGWRKR